MDEPAAEAPPAEPDASDSSPTESTGIVACDEYLELYRKCEPKLMPEIQAGNRRRYESERAWILFMKKSEGEQMEPACSSMKAELDKSCP